MKYKSFPVKESEVTRQILSIKRTVDFDRTLQTRQMGRHVPGPLTMTTLGLVFNATLTQSTVESNVVQTEVM